MAREPDVAAAQFRTTLTAPRSEYVRCRGGSRYSTGTCMIRDLLRRRRNYWWASLAALCLVVVFLIILPNTRPPFFHNPQGRLWPLIDSQPWYRTVLIDDDGILAMADVRHNVILLVQLQSRTETIHVARDSRSAVITTENAKVSVDTRDAGKLICISRNGVRREWTLPSDAAGVVARLPNSTRSILDHLEACECYEFFRSQE
jgi:hypothetical protein